MHILLFALFSRWKKRRPARRVILYTRVGCHLCEEALSLLRRYQKRYGFELKTVDVDGDPALVAEFGDWVPIVSVDGKVRFRGEVNEVLLKRLFDGT